MYVCKSTFAYLLYHPSLLRCVCLSVCPQLCISVYIGMYVCMCMYVSGLCTLRCQKRGRLGVYFLSLSLCVGAREEFTVLAVSGEISLHFSSIIITEMYNSQWPLDKTDDNDAPSVTHRHMQCVT